MYTILLDLLRDCSLGKGKRGKSKRLEAGQLCQLKCMNVKKFLWHWQRLPANGALAMPLGSEAHALLVSPRSSWEIAAGAPGVRD
jgi:hypothetical protein